MALHTHGNQPSRQRVLNPVGDTVTVSFTNIAIIELGTTPINDVIEVSIPDEDQHKVIVLLKEPK